MRDNMSFVLEGKFKDSFSKAIDTALSHVSDQVTESERELFNSLDGNFRKYQGTVERAEKEIRNLLNQTELSENDKIDLLGYFYKLDVDEEKGLLNDAQKELTAEVRKLFEIGDLKPNQMFRVMQVELQNVLDDMKKDFAKGIEETDEFKNAVKSLQDAVNDFYNKNKNKDDEFFNFNNEEVVEFYKNYTKLISLGQKFKFDEDIVPDLYDEDKDRDITSLLDGLKEADKYIDIADNELDSFIEKQQRLRALNIIKEIDSSYFQNIGDNFELEEARKEIERIQSELNLANERLSSAETEVADTKDEVKKLKEELELASKEALNLNDALTNEINYSDYKHDEVIKLRDELKKLKEENARLKSESSEIISSSADNISNVTSEGLGITQNDVNILESIRQELEDIRKALGSVDDDNGFKNIIQSLKETLSLINEINPKVGKGVYNVSLNAGSDNTNIKKAEAQVQKNWIGKYSKYLRSYEKMLKDFDSIGVSEEQLLANIVGKTSPNQYEEVFNRLSLNNIKGLDTAENKVYALVELFQRITTVIDESTNATDQFSETLRNTFEKNKLGTNIKCIYGEATKPIQQAENTSSDEVNDLLEETIKSEQKAEEWKTTLLEIREVLNGISDVLHEISNGNHLIESFKGLNDILDNTLKNLNETVEKISHSKVTLDEDSLKGTDISSETDGFSVLENKIKNGVVGAINLKNEALKEEKEIVQNVVNDEKKSFSELERELNVGVVSAINNKNNAFKEEVKIVASTVNQELKKINELKDTLNQPVNDISNKSDISSGVDIAERARAEMQAEEAAYDARKKAEVEAERASQAIAEEQNKVQNEIKDTTTLLNDLKDLLQNLSGNNLKAFEESHNGFFGINDDNFDQTLTKLRDIKEIITKLTGNDKTGNGSTLFGKSLLGEDKDGYDILSRKISLLEKLGYTVSEIRKNGTGGYEADIIPIPDKAIKNGEEMARILFDIEKYEQNIQSNKSNLSSNDVLPQIEKINDEFEDLGNGEKRVLSDIGLTYEQLIEKLRKENEEIEAGNRLFEERIAYLKDGKVVDSFQGDEKNVTGVTGKDYDKIVHTHPSNARGSNTFSYGDIRRFYDNKMDMPSFAEAELFSEGDIKVVLQIGELTNSYMNKFRKLYQGLQESISIAFGKETDYGHFVPDETINNELVSAYFNSIAKNMINNLGGDLKFNLDDNNIDDKLKNKIIDIANEFVKDIADLLNHIENNISEEDYTKLVDNIYHEKFNKYRDFRNETPVSLGAESSIDKQNELQEELKNTTEILENLSNTNNENKTSESVNKEIQAFDNLNNHINGVKDVITEKNKAIVAEGKLVKETVSKENSDFDSLRKNIDKVNESIEENNKSKNKSNKKTDKTNNKNSEEKITEAGKERLDAYTNILRTEKELAKLRLNEEDHSNEIADLEKKKELYRQIWEEKKKITLSSDDELDKIVKEEEELLRATQNSISSMEAKNADSMGKDFKKQIENMQGALNILSQKNFTDDFKTKIDDLSKRLDEFYQQLKNINPENVDELYDSFKNLELEFDELNKIQKNLAQFKLADQLQLDKLEKQISSFTNKNSAMGRKFKEQFDEISAGIKKAYGDANIEQVKEFQRQILQLQSAVENANKTGDSFGRGLVKRIKSISQSAIAMYFSLWDIIRYVRELASTVTEVDTALTELRKVSDASTERLSQSFEKSAETAKELGATITDVINATSDWSRMGYDISDAEELARVATLFQNVGDNMTADSANSYLISTLKGFQMSADQAEEIVDKYNEVANHFAIDTAGIGEALQRSAASFNAANTDLSKSIALITTANSVVQNPETVGTTFKTLSARIRGAKTELQDLGEEEDEFTQTTSKLRDLVQSLTGFDIMEEDGETFKDIYEIILGIGKEWENLSGIEQASLGEALAGKRNNNTFFAIMNNLDDLEKAYQTAENSAGKIYYLYVQKCA